MTSLKHTSRSGLFTSSWGKRKYELVFTYFSGSRAAFEYVSNPEYFQTNNEIIFVSFRFYIYLIEGHFGTAFILRALFRMNDDQHVLEIRVA